MAQREVGFDTTQLYVGGRWTFAASGQELALIDPSQGSVLALIARGAAADKLTRLEALDVGKPLRQGHASPTAPVTGLSLKRGHATARVSCAWRAR